MSDSREQVRNYIKMLNEKLNDPTVDYFKRLDYFDLIDAAFGQLAEIDMNSCTKCNAPDFFKNQVCKNCGFYFDEMWNYDDDSSNEIPVQELYGVKKLSGEKKRLTNVCASAIRKKDMILFKKNRLDAAEKKTVHASSDEDEELFDSPLSSKEVAWETEASSPKVYQIRTKKGLWKNRVTGRSQKRRGLVDMD
jgi:hypothetical protein